VYQVTNEGHLIKFECSTEEFANKIIKSFEKKEDFKCLLRVGILEPK
jgi:hypothetical protein